MHKEPEHACRIRTTHIWRCYGLRPLLGRVNRLSDELRSAADTWVGRKHHFCEVEIIVYAKEFVDLV